MAGEVSRAEFDGSIQSIRREIQIMGKNLDDRLDQILKVIGDMSKSTSEDSKEVAVLKIKVGSLEEWKGNIQMTNKTLIIGLIISLAAQFIQFWLRNTNDQTQAKTQTQTQTEAEKQR